MSDNPFEIDKSLESSEAFNPAPLDEKTELRTLARALEFAQGFSLLFACCNRHDQRKRLVVELRNRLPKFDVEEIHFEASIDHLLDELRNRLTEPSSDAVFVSGLEYSLPTAADAYRTPLVGNLNAARNSFSLFVPCPLVLWVPEYVLTAIMRGAPDFFSVRSGVHYFAATPQETAASAESLTAEEEWQAASLSLAEKQERIASIEDMLEDYRAFPLEQRDFHAEARLLRRLGGLYRQLGRWAEAEQLYQQGLEIYREVGDRTGEGKVLSNLGNIYTSRRLWRKAEKYHQQSLVIQRESGDLSSEGRTLNNLGVMYERQEQWGDAEKCYQQSLAIKREIGDRIGEGATLNNLGNIHKSQGRWGDAEKCYQQNLTIKREIGNYLGESYSLANLGEIYVLQGRLMEAENCYQQSLFMFRKTGDHVYEGKILENLALLREAQGEIAGALEFGRQAVAVLETTEDKAALEEARQLVAKLEAQIKNEA